MPVHQSCLDTSNKSTSYITISFLCSPWNFEERCVQVAPLRVCSSLLSLISSVSYAILAGVYKPIRSKYSRFNASVATFIASGFFHEWLLSGEHFEYFEQRVKIFSLVSIHH